ncbi:MAG TPA: hypothetical protein DG754_00370, partial [Bacteroidales bacterium]|nr:hypothetical protein [Bacteroidales bacterium]
MAKIILKISVTKLLLILVIAQPSLGFINLQTTIQEDTVSTINKFVIENPHKAIHLINSIATITNSDTIALIGALKAKAYLTLGILDSAKFQIDSLATTGNLVLENSLFEIVNIRVQYHMATGNYATSLQEINHQLKQNPLKISKKLNAKLTILKAKVFEHQKQYPEALSVLEKGLQNFESLNNIEINALFYRNIALISI